eukprot:TRINITY_DN25876_c0_g1_i1.p1 TRINITY_DN25876_c0_g1~~TRINITY_DN25876_c0_g1_i1.p1  ORF type:complete len:798 (-),score=144.65 TRINITY_DN25876_c0_g1_i1:120-2513(-)
MASLSEQEHVRDWSSVIGVSRGSYADDPIVNASAVDSSLACALHCEDSNACANTSEGAFRAGKTPLLKSYSFDSFDSDWAAPEANVMEVAPGDGGQVFLTVRWCWERRRTGSGLVLLGGAGPRRWSTWKSPEDIVDELESFLGTEKSERRLCIEVLSSPESSPACDTSSCDPGDTVLATNACCVAEAIVFISRAVALRGAPSAKLGGPSGSTIDQSISDALSMTLPTVAAAICNVGSAVDDTALKGTRRVDAVRSVADKAARSVRSVLFPWASKKGKGAPSSSSLQQIEEEREFSETHDRMNTTTQPEPEPGASCEECVSLSSPSPGSLEPWAPESGLSSSCGTSVLDYSASSCSSSLLSASLGLSESMRSQNSGLTELMMNDTVQVPSGNGQQHKRDQDLDNDTLLVVRTSPVGPLHHPGGGLAQQRNEDLHDDTVLMMRKGHMPNSDKDLDDDTLPVVRTSQEAFGATILVPRERCSTKFPTRLDEEQIDVTRRLGPAESGDLECSAARLAAATWSVSGNRALSTEHGLATMTPPSDIGSSETLPPVGSATTLPPSDVGSSATLPPAEAGPPASPVPAELGSEATLPPSEVGSEATLPPVDVGSAATLPPAEVGSAATLPPADVGSFAPLPPSEVGSAATLPPSDVGSAAAPPPSHETQTLGSTAVGPAAGVHGSTSSARPVLSTIHEVMPPEPLATSGTAASKRSSGLLQHWVPARTQAPVMLLLDTDGGGVAELPSSKSAELLSAKGSRSRGSTRSCHQAAASGSCGAEEKTDMASRSSFMAAFAAAVTGPRR